MARPSSVERALLALIVALGLALRLWGIGWGLPNAQRPMGTYHPDERINLATADAADIPHLQFDIKYYNYGAFYFYLVSLAETVGRGWGLIPTTPSKAGANTDAAGIQAPSQADEEMVRLMAGRAELSKMFLAGRLVTVLFGVLTIPVLFSLGRRLYSSSAGLAAALLYAFAPLAAVHAHFLTVDVPATLFVTVALLWAARILDKPTWKNYIGAGVAVGIATATKYNVGVVLIAPIVAHLLIAAKDSDRRMRAARLVTLLAVTVGIFVIACPGPWLNWDAFWNGGGAMQAGVRYELFEHARSGHGDLFINTGPGWLYHLRVSLLFGLGYALLALSICGIVFSGLRRRPADILLLAFAVVYYFLTGLSAVRFARYMLPLYPALCLWAARLVTERELGRPFVRIWQVAGVIGVVCTLVYSIGLVRVMTLPDPRDVAAAYLVKTAPMGASIAFAKVPWFFSPPLSPWFGAQSATTRARAADSTTRFRLRIPPAEWDTNVLSPPPDYIVLSNFETMHALRLHERPAIQFLAGIPASYHVREFVPPTVPLIPSADPILPEDILYILPTVRIYERSN